MIKIKNIKINIEFPKNSELKSEMQSVLSYLEKNATLDFKIDTKSFTKSLAEMSNSLASLKDKLSKFGVLDEVVNENRTRKSTDAIKDQTKALQEQQEIINNSKLLSTSKTETVSNDGTKNLIKDLTTIKTKEEEIVKIANTYDAKTKEIVGTMITTTNEIEKQRIAQERQQKTIDNLKSGLQGKLNVASDNELINPSVISNLQNKLNSINTNTAENEIKELKSAIGNLSSDDRNIVRLQNAISTIQNSLNNTRNKYGSLIPKEDLEKTTNELNKLKTLLSEIKSGKNISSTNLSSYLGDANNSLRTMTTNTKNASDALKMTQKDAMSLGEALKTTFEKFGVYASTAMVVRQLFITIKDGISYIKELDSAMVNLKKVTNETQSTYDGFLENAHNIAMEYGSQADKVTEAVTSWVKTGENITNATELAKNTMVLTKVGDLESVAKAQEYMLPTIKAFNIEADNSLQIVDKFNNVANNMATDVNDIGEAMSRSASMMGVAGNSLEETIALMATAESQTKLGGETIGNAFLMEAFRV